MRKELLTIGSMVLMGVLCTGIAASSAWAEEKKPTADFSVSVLSQYVWRGLELSKDSIVIQPSMTVGYKGFAANFWGNMDTNQDEDMYSEGDTSNWNETDFTLSYAGSCSFADYSLGYTYYALEDGLQDTQEVYVSGALQILLAPTLTIYRDIDAGPSWYITFDVSHTFFVGRQTQLGSGCSSELL